MKFDYSIRSTSVIQPLLQIEFGQENVRFTSDALVDSGADLSLFDVQVANQLGLDLKTGVPLTMRGVNGPTQTAYFHRVPIKLGPYHIYAQIGFLTLRDQAYGLLGQHGFFEFFKVAFDYLDRTFEVTPYTFVKKL